MHLRALFVLLGIFVAVLSSACFRGGDDPVEYLHRPDAIIVQMLRLSGDPQPEVADRVVPPDFTLYGDGTLIFLRPSTGDAPSLLQAELPESAVDELLAFIVDEGFLEFRYRHSVEGAASDAPTRFLYVNTKAAVNAISAVDLAGGAANGAKELRSIAEIAQRLSAVSPTDVGGRVVGRYAYDEVALFVQPLQSASGEPPAWPVEGIDLASLAAPGSGVNKQALRVAEAGALLAELSEASWGRYQQDGRIFAVGYRPLLPFEEHFPEFDFSPPTPR